MLAGIARRAPRQLLCRGVLCRGGGLSTTSTGGGRSGGPTYTEIQEKTGRPLSPHVDIYAFPPSAISSITVRITGVAMAAGTCGIAGAALTGGDVATLMGSLGSMGFVGPAAKIAVTFPLTFHYLGAVRHAVWDRMPSTVTNEVAQQSSYAMFAASGAASLLSLTV
jgi:succinate dehydrogenase (ubiquinone) cytochrome b560 subunit